MSHKTVKLIHTGARISKLIPQLCGRIMSKDASSFARGCSVLYNKVNVKGKANPLQAWRGPECSRKLRLPDFKTIGT